MTASAPNFTQVSVGSQTVQISRSGDTGSPVVLLHSSGMSARQWRRLAEQLAPAHQVLAPDFIGAGDSSPWPVEKDFHFLLDVLAIETILDALTESGAGPAHLVGHSYGGLVAMHVALHRFRQLRSVAVYEPVCFGVLHGQKETAQLMTLPWQSDDHPGLSRERGGSEDWLREFVDYWSGIGAWSRLPPPLREGFLRTGRTVYWEVRSLLLDRTPDAVFAQIPIPVLLLRGAATTPAEARVVEILAESLPRATYQIVPGAGHMGPLTHADAVIGLIQAHIAQAEPGGATPLTSSV